MNTLREASALGCASVRRPGCAPPSGSIRCAFRGQGYEATTAEQIADAYVPLWTATWVYSSGPR
jgi:hypothetical protein